MQFRITWQLATFEPVSVADFLHSPKLQAHCSPSIWTFKPNNQREDPTATHQYPQPKVNLDTFTSLCHQSSADLPSQCAMCCHPVLICIQSGHWDQSPVQKSPGGSTNVLPSPDQTPSQKVTPPYSPSMVLDRLGRTQISYSTSIHWKLLLLLTYWNKLLLGI